MKRVYSYLLLLALGVVLLMAAGCSNNSGNAPAGDIGTDNIQQDVGSGTDTTTTDSGDTAGGDTSAADSGTADSGAAASPSASADASQ